MALRTRPRLNALRRSAAEAAPHDDAAAKAGLPPSRREKSQVAFFVDKETKRQLARLGIDEGRSLQKLMLEATNLLFRSRGMARIADDDAG
jgi:hypothetical protein